MVDRYDMVFVPSDSDAAALGPDAMVVPNGVDTARFRATPIGADPVLVFTGTLSWAPNIDGLRWFCAEVLPRVRTVVSDVRFNIVGREPLPEVRALARLPGVHVHADVLEVAPWLGSARAAVVPLRIGSGTRLKALEAMAAGRPVVGTAVGLEGLAVDPGVHALVADDPTAFAEAVVRLLTDDALAARVAASAGEHVRAHYAWDVIGPRFVETLLGVGQRQVR